MRRIIFLLLLVGAAGAETWRVVADGSRLSFRGSTSVQEFHGSARVAGGVIDTDPNRPAGFIEADAASMDTGGARRDRRMHAEVMRSKLFPSVRFDLRAVDPTPDGMIARGTWTMRGIAREVAIPVRLARGNQVRAIAAFVLDIRRWDIEPPRVMVIAIDPDVRVEIDLLLRPDPDAVAPRIDRSLNGVVAVDAADTAIDLGQRVANTSVVLFEDAGAVDATTWCARLKEAGLAVLAVRHGERAGVGGPAEALTDAPGAIRARLAMPRARVAVLAFGDDAQLIDVVLGAPRGEAVARSQRMMGASPP
ncbi:MAG TPA: YceI family protein [Planctomycetota bacterium]|nr:YceI family protein [Planctomycetota bacterium]